MAECSYARCVQERRAIKKELQRWTKNMVFVVGLERVAEELMGRRKWRQYQDVVLRSRLIAEVEPETSDWEPQDKCCFCDGGTFIGPARSPASDSGSSTNSRSSFRETPPVSLDSHSSSAAHISSPAAMTTLESVTSMAASLAAVAALSVNSNNATSATSGASANPSTAAAAAAAAAMSIFPPANPHSGLFPPWYMSPPPPHLPPNLRLDTVPHAPKQESPIPAMVMSLPASTASEQPLDLSAKATSCAIPSVNNNNNNNSRVCARSPTPDPSLKVPSVIDKHIFKAKPRMSAVAGRRQYTEEELQAALRDIQSGKLGTRRAAVIYGIPRSTLRNKVYKLAMERERDSHLNPITLVDKALLPPVVPLKEEEDCKEEDEEEKELSGAEEEREVEKALRKPLLSMEDLVRFSMLEGGGLMTADSLRTLLQHGKFLEEKRTVDRGDGSPSPTLPPFPSTADIWQGLEHSALGPFISQILANTGGQNRDLSSGIGNKNPEGGLSSTPRENSPTNIVSDFLPKFPSPLLPELVRRMMVEDEQMRKSRMVAHQTDVNFLVNGAHSDEAFCKSEEKGKMGNPVGLPSQSVITRSDVSKADTEESSDAPATSGPSGMATPPNVILKIPSFKPTSKNGVASSGTPSGLPSETLSFTHSAFPHSSITPESSQHLSMSVPLGSGGSRSNHSDSCSPPIPNLSGKGIGVSLRDVIAKSISQKFQQQGTDISHLSLSQKLLLPGEGGDQPPYKRGRFTPPGGCNPSSIAASVIKHNNNNTHSDDKNKMSTSTTTKQVTSGTIMGSTSSGGKGTRPKRGKYRNYDRDSLVEAVRAVQRGEMSVHRAGSYYGVPHSTLEYKVKERHLMRPRKREQKPQMETSKPKEECSVVKGTSPSTTATGTSTPSIPVTAEKLKTPPKPPKPPFAPTSPLPTAPNGLKIPPLYDPSISHLAYSTPPPFPFWPPSPFHPSLPLPDFGRSGSTSGGFSPGSDFLASQMMQRLHEESSRVHGSASPGISSAVRSPPVVNTTTALGKSAREMAESLYDGTGANGSFLDGIIRSSLEMGIPPGALKDGVGNPSEKITAPENLSNKALLDQLCRNSRLAPLPRPSTQSHHSSDEESLKQLSDSSSTKSTSAAEVAPTAVVDLSSVSSGKTECESKTKSTEEEESVQSPKPINIEEKSFVDDDDNGDDNVKPLLKETNGLSNAKDDPNDNVSACDSMSNLMRVSDIEAAKDLQQEGGSDDPETQEDTKSNKINS